MFQHRTGIAGIFLHYRLTVTMLTTQGQTKWPVKVKIIYQLNQIGLIIAH
jgi:hypothetical protein